MRKITQQIANSFLLGKALKINNTETDGKAVYLHNNKIAEITEEGLKVSLAGWNTVTTRERLNGILYEFGLNTNIRQKDYEPYLNGKLINCNEWYLVPFRA